MGSTLSQIENTVHDINNTTDETNVFAEFYHIFGDDVYKIGTNNIDVWNTF